MEHLKNARIFLKLVHQMKKFQLTRGPFIHAHRSFDMSPEKTHRNLKEKTIQLAR